jgi:hypothetical protein
VSPVRYELGFYIPEDDILHSYRRENLKSYIACEDDHSLPASLLFYNDLCISDSVAQNG